MAFVEPVTLTARGVKLVPLALEHEAGLQAAAADGELWKLRITSVPEPHETLGYIETALATANRFAFAVTDAASGEVQRLEIGYTWYAARWQRTASTPPASCCCSRTPSRRWAAQLVGWRTDNFNFASQRAIERLGARRTACCATTRCAATAPFATP
jgi:hypothetical protein